MGGALLQLWNLPTNRIPKNEYEKLGDYLIDALNTFCPDRKYRIYKSFKNKISYGDIDIQVESISGDKIDWIKFFRGLSGYHPHKNGHTISVPIKGFQSDFNFIGSENYEISYIYHSYETGNFLGRQANAMGALYGHKGLFLHIPLNYFNSELPSHEFKDIQVTKNAKEIFAILGYDYSRFEKEFNDESEMFDWIVKSRYFNPALFAFEALNSPNRTRNRKRACYARFVELCKNLPTNSNSVDKEKIREKIIQSYPHIQGEIDKARAEILLNKERRAKFNGHIVTQMFGLEGPELGSFIVVFKKKFGKFEEYLDKSAAEDVRTDMTRFYVAEFSTETEKGM